MSHRAVVWLIWSLYGLVTGLVIVWSGADLLSRDTSRGALYLASEALISLATPLVFAIVAALIVSRQRRNTIGWVNDCRILPYRDERIPQMSYLLLVSSLQGELRRKPFHALR
jgi:hypothetical protein